MTLKSKIYNWKLNGFNWFGTKIKYIRFNSGPKMRIEFSFWEALFIKLRILKGEKLSKLYYKYIGKQIFYVDKYILRA